MTEPRRVLEEYARANSFELSDGGIVISETTLSVSKTPGKSIIFAVGAKRDDIMYALGRIAEFARCSCKPVYLGNGSPF